MIKNFLTSQEYQKYDESSVEYKGNALAKHKQDIK